jgi:hypothetical protein
LKIAWFSNSHGRKKIIRIHNRINFKIARFVYLKIISRNYRYWLISPLFPINISLIASITALSLCSSLIYAPLSNHTPLWHHSHLCNFVAHLQSCFAPF